MQRAVGVLWVLLDSGGRSGGGCLVLSWWRVGYGRCPKSHVGGLRFKAPVVDGRVIQGCLLRVHRCTVGRNHDVSSSVPARTVRTGAPGLGLPLIHEPQSGHSQRIVTLPLSVVRSTSRGSAAVIRNARSAMTIPIEKALLVIR